MRVPLYAARSTTRGLKERARELSSLIPRSAPRKNRGLIARAARPASCDTYRDIETDRVTFDRPIR
jgi:hypothetical protein